MQRFTAVVISESGPELLLGALEDLARRDPERILVIDRSLDAATRNATRRISEEIAPRLPVRLSYIGEREARYFGDFLEKRGISSARYVTDMAGRGNAWNIARLVLPYRTLLFLDSSIRLSDVRVPGDELPSAPRSIAIDPAVFMAQERSDPTRFYSDSGQAAGDGAVDFAFSLLNRSWAGCRFLQGGQAKGSALPGTVVAVGAGTSGSVSYGSDLYLFQNAQLAIEACRQVPVLRVAGSTSFSSGLFATTGFLLLTHHEQLPPFVPGEDDRVSYGGNNLWGLLLSKAGGSIYASIPYAFGSCKSRIAAPVMGLRDVIYLVLRLLEPGGALIEDRGKISSLLAQYLCELEAHFSCIKAAIPRNMAAFARAEELTEELGLINAVDLAEEALPEIHNLGVLLGEWKHIVEVAADFVEDGRTIWADI